MAANRVSRTQIELGRQLVFFNELFGWARVAFSALTDRPPPNVLYGPCPAGTDTLWSKSVLRSSVDAVINHRTNGLCAD